MSRTTRIADRYRCSPHACMPSSEISASSRSPPRGPLACARVFGNLEPIVAVPDDDRGENQYVSIRQFNVPDRNISDHCVLQRPNLRHVGMNQKKPGNRKDRPSKDENLRIDVFHGRSHEALTSYRQYANAIPLPVPAAER